MRKLLSLVNLSPIHDLGREHLSFGFAPYFFKMTRPAEGHQLSLCILTPLSLPLNLVNTIQGFPTNRNG
jgi:hypothetical protein